MANRERGEIALTVGRRQYLLRLTTGACCELEDHSDADLDVLVQRINDGCLTALRGVLWASLQAEHAVEFQDHEHVGDTIDAIGGPAAALRVIGRLMALNADDAPDTKSSSGHRPSEPEHGSKWRRLYLDARSTGISAEAFWRLSLKELWRELAVVRQVVLRDQERDVTVAWLTANYTRADKLPELDKLLAKKHKQTVSEQKAMMYQLSARLGVPVQWIPNKKEPTDGYAQG